ncbi:MAG: D-alanyl-D-alanine carboxypeptidase, partial [Rhodanobacteraceae bacterium]
MKTFAPALLAATLLTGGMGLAGARPALAQTASAVPTQAAAATLAGDIDAYIAQPQFARADWGIAVRSLDTGKVIYQHNADRLFVPASNAKLFTT